MSKRTTLGLIFGALLLAPVTALVWAAPQASSTNKSTTTQHHATASQPTVSLLNPASLRRQAPPVFHARFTTTKGDFVIEVTRAWAPRGADRFYNLVRYHFYDNASFFRVLPGFVVQFGISGRPDLARVWERANIPDDPVTQTNARGTLTFATAGPNTRTTQVFINLNDNANLDSQGFSPFGKVTSGMEVVEKLYSGYGEGAPQGSGPDQERLQKEGRAYLAKSFPLLDAIKLAVIVPPAPATPRPTTPAHAKPTSTTTK